MARRGGRYARPQPWMASVPDAGFAMFLVLVAGFHYAWLTDRAAPATIDSGNWLAFGHALLGHSVRDPGIIYPPLVPVLATLLAKAFGPITAAGLLGALASITPAAGAYLAIRHTHGASVRARWALAPLAALLAVTGSTGEATAWGGFPQLIGMGITPVLLVLVDRALRETRWRATLAAAGAMGLLLLTSHFVFTFALFSCGALTLLALAAEPGDRARWARRRLPHLAGIGVPAVVIAPFYLPLVRAMGENRAPDVDSALTLSNAIRSLEFTYRDLPSLWHLLIVLAVVIPIVLWSRWRGAAWRLTASSAAGVVIGSAVSGEARFLYFIPLVCVFAGALWIHEVIDTAPTGEAAAPDLPVSTRLAVLPGRLLSITAALLVVAVLVQGWTGAHLFAKQRDYYGIVTPGIFDAMRWIRAETPSDAVIGVATVDDAPLGWWVEGFAERRTIYASPLQWLVYPDELRRAKVANDVFAPPFPTEASMAAARDAGMTYLLVATGSNRIDPDELNSYLADHPETVVFRGPDVLVLDPRAG